jgi:hypothetical protein
MSEPAEKDGVNDEDTFPIVLPSGYDYDDFDKICGLARGHIGWGNPHCFLPPCLSDTHSVPARHRSHIDPYFDLYRLLYRWTVLLYL